MAIDITLEGISPDEAERYLEKAPHGAYAAHMRADGQYVDIEWAYATVTPFERIRRITGYLVGTLDRFNDAKRAEVEDRVKHA